MNIILKEKLEAFRVLVEKQQAERYTVQYPNSTPPIVTVKPGRRWVKVDVGTSGKYMVDVDGAICGIKGYGVPHHGKRYGSLDTTEEFDWSGYAPVERPEKTAPCLECGGFSDKDAPCRYCERDYR